MTLATTMLPSGPHHTRMHAQAKACIRIRQANKRKRSSGPQHTHTHAQAQACIRSGQASKQAKKTRARKRTRKKSNIHTARSTTARWKCRKQGAWCRYEEHKTQRTQLPSQGKVKKRLKTRKTTPKYHPKNIPRQHQGEKKTRAMLGAETNWFWVAAPPIMHPKSGPNASPSESKIIQNHKFIFYGNA